MDDTCLTDRQLSENNFASGGADQMSQLPLSVRVTVQGLLLSTLYSHPVRSSVSPLKRILV